MKNIRTTRLFSLLSMLLLSLAFVSCEDETSDVNVLLDRERQIIEDHLAENGISEYEVTPSGIYHYTLREGSADNLPNGAIGHIGYEGRLPYGYIFDSSYLRDDTLKVQQGTGRSIAGYTQQDCDTLSTDPIVVNCVECPSFQSGVIPGWVEAMDLLKVDQKKRFYIPSYLAYGASGQGPIPGNSILIFDMELFGYEGIPSGCNQQ